MSYILDALRKVEREKTRKAKTGGMTSISGDLFQERVRRSSIGGTRRTIFLIVLASLVTFGATWLLLRDGKSNTSVRSASTITKAVATPALPPPAPVSPPVPRQAVETKLPVPAMPAPVVAPKPAAPAAEEAGRASATEKRSARKASAQLKPQKEAIQTIPAPADIKLSGIAWQEERSARRVVINGFLMQEGATVSGAKIMEIHQDRVRFALPAGLFDLRMDAATPLAAQK